MASVTYSDDIRRADPTPDAQYLYAAFDVTVNACDAQWNIITTCKDTVHFTSSDSTAVLPSDAALASGTLTVTGQVAFGTAGAWTITASDVTNTKLSSGVSTSITVQ